MEIKVGDTVVCRDNSDNNLLTNGKKYKVIKIKFECGDNMIYVFCDGNKEYGFYDWRFELDICSIRKNKLEKLYGNEGR